MPKKEPTHGKPSTYNNHKCRCKPCTDAWAEYMRPRVQEYRKLKRQEREERGEGL